MTSLHTYQGWYPEKHQTVIPNCKHRSKIAAGCITGSRSHHFPEENLLWEEYPELFLGELPTRSACCKSFATQNPAGFNSPAGSDQLNSENSLLDSISDVVWRMDKDLNLIFVSSRVQDLLGYSPQQFLNVPKEYHFPSELVRKYRAVKRMILGKIRRKSELVSSNWEFQCVHRDGRILWVETDITPLFADNGALLGFGGSIRNVTTRIRKIRELELARDAARDETRAKSEFLADMSHESRTHMNGILGMLQLIQFTDLNSQQHEFVENAIQSGKSLLHHLSDILDLSKIEARQITLENDNIQIESLLESVLADCRGLIQSSDLVLQYSIDHEVPQFIQGDEKRFHQILLNLLSNAIKFTDRGNITVSVTTDTVTEDYIPICFSVKDTGAGISAEMIRHLFKPFVQADSPTTFHRGSGLGLHIVKQLVELMGGTVSMESEKGVGTTVSFQIPVKPSTEVTPSLPEKTGDKKRKEISSLRILVVEDDQINAVVVSAMLHHLGHSTTHVDCGLQAMKLLKDETFDCILLDIQLPEMSGIEISKAIRRDLHQLNAQVPIIALTAYAMKGDREQFLSAGMNEYLTKPVNVKALNDALQKVVSQ